ncbi:transporter substrate-binding domain-containing protein [Phormidium tenue FACHB-886]|nr:transporter substrate-binding domain-containing protein [Phormidium tenue FACHB-886]
MTRFVRAAVLTVCGLLLVWTDRTEIPSAAAQATSPTVAPTPAVPETVLERVKRTGVLLAGARADSPPFGYVQPDGEWVGYSVDMLRLVQQALQQQLKREVRLELVETNVSNWSAKLTRQQIDIACGAISITNSRQLDANFSIGYFRTGTQFLIRASHQLTPPEFRVGVVRGADDEYSVEDGLQLARVVRFTNRAAGLKALNAGQIDALASDGVLLEGLRQSLPNPDEFEIMPPQPLGTQVYGCALPDDPEFRLLVNQTLLNFMQGVVNQNSQDVAIFETWFGEDGVAPVDRTQVLNFFRQMIQFYEPPSPNPAPQQ